MEIETTKNLIFREQYLNWLLWEAAALAGGGFRTNDTHGRLGQADELVLAAIERCGFKLETLDEAQKRWKGEGRFDTVRWEED